MIEVHNLSKQFDGETIFHDLNATFEAGRTNLIIGRSGSGKTVLMKCLVGLLTPDSGQVLYDGRDFHALPPRQLGLLRQEMGVLFQGAALFDAMSVVDNVLFPLRMFSSDSEAAQRARAEECLARVDMADAVNKMPGELSGGMQKRVGIARAIALRPRYLFCDEPTSGLDPVTARRIDELIHSITHEAGITTVINTHDMESVRTIGESVLSLDEQPFS
ncbi:MAG: ATP-binding cassette domain-containing protein [Bacteroidaceae bacterium]|nr:ATP-binding cassette domain-containing protein [Bacteroidaceae bacterium]